MSQEAAPALEAPVEQAAAPVEQQQAAPQEQAPVEQPAPAPAVDEYAAFKSDPRFQEITKAFKEGKVDEYLKETTKTLHMAPADVIREDIKRNNPGLSDRAVEVLFKKELESLNIEGDDEDATIAKELLQAKANKIRDGWKNSPAQPQASLSPENTIKAYQESAQAQAAKQIEDAVTGIKASSDYKGFETNRIVKTGGDFNYEVPKEVDVIKSLTDASTFGKFIQGADGKLDVQKGMRLVAFAHDMDAYDKALVNYGKSLGAKSEFDELENSTAGRALPASAINPVAKPKYSWGGAVAKE